MRWTQVVAIVFGLCLLAGGVHLLRSATESTHYETHRDSQLLVVVEAEANRADPARTLEELTEAHFGYCRLEIGSDQVGGLRRVDGTDDQFAVVLQPALDSTDRKQYQGCLEDWTVDHHRLQVVAMEDLGPEPDEDA